MHSNHCNQKGGVSNYVVNLNKGVTTMSNQFDAKYVLTFHRLTRILRISTPAELNDEKKVTSSALSTNLAIAAIVNTMMYAPPLV